MAEAYAFLSDEWVRIFQEKAQELLDDTNPGPDARIIYKEYFPDAPVPRSDGKEVGIYLKVADGKVTIRSGVDPREPADCTVRMAYAASLASMGVKFGPELTEMNKKVRESGGLEIEGSLDAFPLPMDLLHNAMVDITLQPA